MLRYHMESIEEYFDMGKHPNNLPSDLCCYCLDRTGRIMSHPIRLRLSSSWDSACHPALPTSNRTILQEVVKAEKEPERVEKSSNWADNKS